MLIRSLLIFFSASLCAFGEDEKVTQSSVRFIVLGDHPDPLKPYEIPPNPVIITDSGKLRGEVPLVLNTISKSVSLDPGTTALEIWEKKDLAEGPWLKGSLEGFCHSLAVLYLDQVEDTWKKPKVKFLPDDAEAFPVGRIRFVNTTEQVMLIKLGKLNPFGLAPGAAGQKSMEVGKTSLKIGFLSSDKLAKTIWQNHVILGEKERIQCFFSKTRKKSSGGIKFLHFRETAPEEKEAPKK